MPKRPDTFFEPPQETGKKGEGLKHRAASGVSTMLLSQGSGFAFTLLIGAVLARLIAPADFGLYAMAGAGVGIVNLFKDFGLSNATIQAKHLNHALLSTLFWINVGICSLLMAVACVASPLIAWFFAEPGLISIICISSISFFGTGLGLQHTALLRRKMRFGLLFRLGLINMILGGVLSVTLAALGFGVWALVIPGVFNPFLSAGLVTIASGWLPGLPRRSVGARQLVVFGAKLSGFNLINWFARNADNIIIGRFLGAIALGLYSRAYNLLLMPLRRVKGPFDGAMVPVLSRLADNPERYCRFFYHGVQVLLGLLWPITAFLLIVAEDAVLLLLGENWLESVDIFRALGLAALVRCTNFITGWAYQSYGHVGRQLKAVSVQTPFIVGSFFIGLPWGVTGVAWSYSVCCLLLRLPYVWWCFHGMPLSLTELFSQSFRWPLIATSLAGGICWWSTWLVPSDWIYFVRLVTFGAIFGSVYMSIWLWLPGPRRALTETWKILDELHLFKRLRHKAAFLRVKRFLNIAN